jgi:hypothetical protein
MNTSNKPREMEYLESMNEKERKGYEIAKNHLGSAFSLEKSVGYVAWLEKLVSTTKPK